MTKTFTENDIIQFVYGELAEDKICELKKALVTDSELMNRLIDFQSLSQKLDHVSVTPSNRTVDKILSFSAGYQKESFSR